MPKYGKWVIAIGLIILLGGVAGYSEEWTLYGPRAQGMGGAGVAVGDGATASYWNPAAMAKNNQVGLYLPFGTTLSAEGDIMKTVDTLFDTINASQWTTISNKISSGQSLTLDETRTALDIFVNKIPAMNEPGQGLLFNLNAGATFTLGNFGVFANMLTDAGVHPTVDLSQNLSLNSSGGAAAVFNVVGNGNDRSAVLTPAGQLLANDIAAVFAAVPTAAPQNQAEELVYQAELAGVDTSNPYFGNLVKSLAQATAGSTTTVALNPSGVTLSGIAIKEAGISYGKSLMDDKLAIGGNLKVMEAETFYKFYRFDNLEESGDFANDITNLKNRKKSTGFGVDAGALLSLTDNLKAGLTARNINKPKFDWAGPGDYKLDPQLRAGISFKLPFVLLAVDYDLNKNESVALDGYESQMFALGAEIDLWLLRLRAGMYQNLASAESGPVYTVGTSLNLLLVQLDIAAAMATDTVKIEAGSGSEEIAERYSANLALSVRF